MQMISTDAVVPFIVAFFLFAFASILAIAKRLFSLAALMALVFAIVLLLEGHAGNIIERLPGSVKPFVQEQSAWATLGADRFSLFWQNPTQVIFFLGLILLIVTILILKKD